MTVPSPTTHAIGQACKEAAMVVSVGVNERDGGTLYNRQLLRCARMGTRPNLRLNARHTRVPLRLRLGDEAGAGGLDALLDQRSSLGAGQAWRDRV